MPYDEMGQIFNEEVASSTTDPISTEKLVQSPDNKIYKQSQTSYDSESDQFMTVKEAKPIDPQSQEYLEQKNFGNYKPKSVENSATPYSNDQIMASAYKGYTPAGSTYEGYKQDNQKPKASTTTDPISLENPVKDPDLVTGPDGKIYRKSDTHHNLEADQYEPKEGAKATNPFKSEDLMSKNFGNYSPQESTPEDTSSINLQNLTRGYFDQIQPTQASSTNTNELSPKELRDRLGVSSEERDDISELRESLNQIPEEPETTEEVPNELLELNKKVERLEEQLKELKDIIQALSNGRSTPEPIPFTNQGNNVGFVPFPEVGTSQVNSNSTVATENFPPAIPSTNQGNNVGFVPFPEVGTSQATNTNNSDNLPPTEPFPIESIDKGLETPEQKLLATTKRLEELSNRTNLTQEEIAEKSKLQIEAYALNQQINNEITESNKQRERKEKIVKIVAGVVGAGLAIATPPVAIAAVLGVTLGGRIATPLIKYGSNKLRERSTNAKYENRIGLSQDELDKLDRKIKRNEWWANRLGELAAVVDGGTMGYGLGKFAQNMFGWKGINFDGNNIDTPKGISGGMQRPANIPTENIPNPTQPPTGGEIPTNSSVLVENGRVNLPGSAWNGNLANEAAQDILTGGELNFSNYNGGLEEMAAHMLEKDLVGTVTRDQLLNNLSTPEIHRLLNLYRFNIQSGITDPNLADMLGQLGTEGAKNLLNIIK